LKKCRKEIKTFINKTESEERKLISLKEKIDRLRLNCTKKCDGLVLKNKLALPDEKTAQSENKISKEEGDT
jgi:hypothetical protein